ncbi:MAG: hypothetical protein ACKESB_03305 [Candidatus Hodgkinia cicadicola]
MWVVRFVKKLKLDCSFDAAASGLLQICVADVTPLVLAEAWLR